MYMNTYICKKVLWSHMVTTNILRILYLFRFLRFTFFDQKPQNVIYFRMLFLYLSFYSHFLFHSSFPLYVCICFSLFLCLPPSLFLCRLHGLMISPSNAIFRDINNAILSSLEILSVVHQIPRYTHIYGGYASTSNTSYSYDSFREWWWW